MKVEVVRAKVAAALLAIGVLTAPITPAEAAVLVVPDPVGDVADRSFDVRSLAVDYTDTRLIVTLTTEGALPQLSDPSWSKDEGRGRTVVIAVDAGATGDLSVFAMVNGDGSFVYDLESGQELCRPTTVISGKTLRVSAPASCIKAPNTAAVTAIVGDFVAEDMSALDIAPDSFSGAAMVTLRGGYWVLAKDGGVFSFGDAQFYGSTGNLRLNAPVVGMAGMPNDDGYRFVATDGGIFNYGSAQFYGSRGGQPLNKPVVGMTNTASGNGYWLVASDGGIFTYGDAGFYGSTGSLKLNQPIVGMAATPTGKGYWLVARDGGIFTFGDAQFFGSAGSEYLSQPIVGMAVNEAGDGYWLATADGDIFNYGAALFRGATVDPFMPFVAAIDAAEGGAYRTVSIDGAVQTHGSFVHFGDIYDLNISLNAPVVDMETTGRKSAWRAASVRAASKNPTVSPAVIERLQQVGVARR